MAAAREDESARLLEQAAAARARGDLKQAKSKLRAAAEAAARGRSPVARARALEALGEIANEEGDPVRGRVHWESARDAYLEAGDAAGAARARAAGPSGTAAAGRAGAGQPEAGASAPEVDSKTEAFLELLRDATARLADPRPQAVEDAVFLSLKGAIALTGTERGFVARRGPPEQGGLTFLAGLDARGRKLDARDFKVSMTIVTSVLESGRALAANDLREEPRFAGATSVNELKIRASLCAPLADEESACAGVLYVDGRTERPYADADRRFFESLANCVSAIYRSARLRDRIAELNLRLEEKVERQGQELETTRSFLERARAELSLRHEYPEIVGRSVAMAEVLKLVDRVAETAFPVLLEGDSGTGKELVARAVHRASPRQGGPFLSLNCAAVSGSLIESELFGHVRGAFTGAIADRPGLFELADGGTLLLDDVDDMSREMQASLLRVLQEHEIRRVGDKETRKVSVRVVAATTRDLQEQVGAGLFREDLYYRLAVLKVRLPQLRERREDIPDLLRHFLARHAKADGRRPPAIDRDALEALVQRDWPGNVRELENAARHLLTFAGPRIALSAVERLPGSGPPDPARDALVLAGTSLSLRDLERLAIEGRLRANNWHQGKTARSLGIDRKTLYTKVRGYGLAIDGAGSPAPEEAEG
jgi:transcriptional regulator with GAF, ATPase, and Fis domain